MCDVLYESMRIKKKKGNRERKIYKQKSKKNIFRTPRRFFFFVRLIEKRRGKRVHSDCENKRRKTL